jgi:hypothetical protein
MKSLLKGAVVLAALILPSNVSAAEGGICFDTKVQVARAMDKFAPDFQIHTVLNKKKWETLSPREKRMFTAATGEYVRFLETALDAKALRAAANCPTEELPDETLKVTTEKLLGIITQQYYLNLINLATEESR